MKTLIVIALVILIIAFLFLSIHSLMMQEDSILYEEWERNPIAYRTTILIVQAVVIVLAASSYNLKMYVATSFSAALFVGIFFIAYVYNNVIKQDVNNREF